MGSTGSSAPDTAKPSTLKQILSHMVAGGLTLVVLGVIMGAFTLFRLDKVVEQFEMKSYDLRAQWGESSGRPSSDVMILEFDEASMNVLSDEFGLWPWSRDVHARMIHFMNRAGVKLLLYDIMFVSHRKGSEAADEQLAQAFHQYDNVYLSMNFDRELAESQKLGKDLTPRAIEKLLPLSISLRSELGKHKNDFIKLKPDNDGALFFDNEHMTFNNYRSIMPSLLSKGRNIGIINHGADDDGVSRSNPLFFRFKYHKFIKTNKLPLKQSGDKWYDTQGARTDADGYLLVKANDRAAQSSWINPTKSQHVDEEGYLTDNYGHPLYMREAKITTAYFPYLGLRAVLELKFPKKQPELLLTADGHLKFEGYDIPLNSNGDFLVNWYNVNVDWETYRRHRYEITKIRDANIAKITELETQIKQTSNPQTRKKLETAIQQEKATLDKAKKLLVQLDQILNGIYAPKPYKTMPAWEVIRTMKKEEAGLPLNEEDVALKKMLQDKIIFVGATSVAAYDIKNTSIHSTMPGVILQANLFDNIYQNDGKFMKRLDPNSNLLLTVLICVLSACLTFKMRSALAGMLTAANIAVIYVLAAITMYQQLHLWVNVAMPLVALIITTTITFMIKYILRNKDYEETYTLATTDSMTGLYNHRYFQDHMRRSIEQAARFKHKFSLVLIDIDFFKKFNDTYGHQAGDEVLRHVAQKLQKSVRTVDVVARYGGEEMAIILDRATEEEALIVAQKIVKAVAEEAYPIAEGVAKHVTISCGVSTYPTHGETPNVLIEFSDAGLYRAKENGRNQVGAQYETNPPEGGDGAEHSDHHAA